MTIETAIKEASKLFININNNYGVSHMESVILMCYALNISNTDIITKNDYELKEDEEKRFFSLCKRRLKYEPISYITNSKEFYGYKFFINENVLIPRPETEELIDLIKSYIKNEEISICDIGGGSGNIGITLKKLYKNINMTIIDTSEKAIKVIKKNALNILGTEDSIEIICTDALEYLPKNKFDIIVSNGPYISTIDKKKLPKDVLFEPYIALFSGYEGLDFYKKLINKLNIYLECKGKFFFEIGENQGKALIKICRNNNINTVCIKKDLNRKERFLICLEYN